MKKTILTSAALALLASPVFAAQKTPADILDLSCWKISIPVEAENGFATTVEEKVLTSGFVDSDNFYVNEAGDGVVFSSPVKGVTTSKNTTYTRSELHEMGRCSDTSIEPYGVGPDGKRAINKNNWVFGSSPESAQKIASGVNGTMDAVLSVDQVAEGGEVWQQGRVIVGQIHANDDEPAKLYYRKMPNHDQGSVWLVHETNGGVETTYPLVGNNVPDYYTQDGEVIEPTDGIKLGERWGYQIKTVENELTVTIRRDGKDDVVQVVDMSDSGYDDGEQYMFFKAGLYHVNRSGAPDERASVTFYDLQVSHD
ncbi:polysaccharide lyase family 7 protein [Vibrio superstes]|uniref:Alginate lyase n=1 Tax=Vibrio superstes NBRC 103154 TaxID=1219062 RepID=A0A511QQU7_9VIBR|nr:polysaccharide lyase family 7 protein [Vibrio superstes]GEM78942.1 alginate lyase [Vibrio superstes NBRC 103154]